MKRFFALMMCLVLLVTSGLSNTSADQIQYADSSKIPPLASALHVLPPIGENTAEVNRFDESLTPYLKVSIWQVLGPDSYVPLAEFTSEKQNNGLDYIKLQGKQYHVNWDINKKDIGKEILIHFTVSGLNVGHVTYTIKTGKTLPIKFRIDDHPSIRARVLKEQNRSALDITLALIDEFQLGGGEIAQILTDEEFEVLQIGDILNDVFGCSALEAAQLLSGIGEYSASEIAQVLIDVYGMNSDTLGAAQILKAVGFGASQISGALKGIFGLETAAIINILGALGFSTEELFSAQSRELAEKFAPQLRFDQSATTFPMSAQEYFDNSIKNNGGRLENNDPNTLKSPQLQPPTYYKAYKVGNQIRILYWWYYGYQPGCWMFGVQGYHDGDWERVMVTLSEDASMVVAVTFWQHTGYYTRLTIGGDLDKFAGATYGFGLSFAGKHPIVYVGKGQHGSYSDQGGYGDMVSGGGLAYCDYYADYRNNENNPALQLDTEGNLKSLADFEEPWMLEEASVSNGSIGTGDGATVAFDLDSRYVLAGTVKVKMDGVQLGEAEATFSNGTGSDGVDQIIFSTAPEVGAQITADWAKGDFLWGRGAGENDHVHSHPVQDSAAVNIIAMDACSGMSKTVFADAGCYDSQCEYHDNQSLWTMFYPGTCSHCPSGYTDMGFYCGKGTWPWEWRTTSIHYYGLDYTLSQGDRGLLKTR